MSAPETPELPPESFGFRGDDDCGLDACLAYVYEELEPVDTETFEAHLRASPDCAERVARIREWRTQLHEVVLADPFAQPNWGGIDAAVLQAAASIAQERAESRSTEQAADADVAFELPELQPARFEPRPPSFLEQLRSWFLLGGGMAAAAAAVLLVLAPLQGAGTRPLAPPGSLVEAAQLPAATFSAAGGERSLGIGAELNVAGQGAQLSLVNGSEARLKPGAQARVAGLGTASLWLELQRGSVENAVRPLGPTDFYVIETAHALVSVEGTGFIVSLSEDGTQTKVDVHHGRVRVTPKAAPQSPRVLLRGDAMELSAGGFTTPIAPAPVPKAPSDAAPSSRAPAPQKAVEDPDDFLKGPMPKMPEPPTYIDEGRSFTVEPEQDLTIERESVE